MHQWVLGPRISSSFPARDIDIPIRLRMPFDIVRSLVPRRITRRHLLAFFLVPAHVVDMHDRRKDKVCELNIDPTVRNPQVEDETHGFLGDVSLAYVPVWTDRASIEAHHLALTDDPGDVSVFVAAGCVFEGESLVFSAVVPVVIEHRGRADGLLIWSAGVGVGEGEAVVGRLHEVVVGVVEDVEGGNLVRLRCDADAHTTPVAAHFCDVDFWGAAAFAGGRVIVSGAGT